MLFTILISIFVLIILIWFIGFLIANDLKVPTKSISKFKNILIIYPHPDDESLTVSGLSKIAQKISIPTTLLVLTKGGAGETQIKLSESLKDTRTKEMKNSAKIIGINNLIQKDLPDGRLNKNKKEVLRIVSEQITKTKPDLVITYDLSGLYGHEDHMILSEIVTNLINKKYKNIKLWYSGSPKKVLNMIDLPVHMAKDKIFLKKRMTPNLKIFTGFNFIYSYLSVKAHKSQYKPYVSKDLWFIPLWFVYSTQLFEYFYEVKQK